MARPVTRSQTRKGAVSSAPAPKQPVLKKHNETEHETIKSAVCDSFASDSIICSSSVPDQSSPSAPLSDDILASNRILLLRLEQEGVLAPGVLTMDAHGQLRADLSVEPDAGTMAGLFPTQDTTDSDDQIPSWLRDHLIKEMDVLSRGPPAGCEPMYDHLKTSQMDVGINTSVSTAETLLTFAVMSLRRSIDDVQYFVDSEAGSEFTFDLDRRTLVRTVERLVRSGDKELPRDVQTLIDLAGMGVVMKGAVDEALRTVVISPYSRLADKLDLIAKALRLDLDRAARRKDGASVSDGDPQDSGIEAC